MTTRFIAIITLLACALVAAYGCGGKEDESRTPEGIPVIGAAAIDSFITAGGVSLIEFGGKTCGPCKTMRGILRDRIASDPGFRTACVYWETDPEAFKRFNVGGVPAQLVFDAEGKEVLRHVGVWEREELDAAVDSIGAFLQTRAILDARAAQGRE